MTGRPLGLIWELNSYHLWCPYNRLFSTPVFEVGPECVPDDADRYTITDRSTFVSLNNNNRTIYVVEENFFWIYGETNILVGQHGPHRVNTELRNDLRREFRELQPSAEVSRSVEAFGDVSQLVGVHARREDNVWSNRYCSDVGFAQAMADEVNRRDCKFLLATDSEQTESYLRRVFGERIVTYPVRSLERGKHPEAIIDAFVLMLLLAKTRKIIRSSSSTYSQCASWFGETPTREIGKLQHRD